LSASRTGRLYPRFNLVLIFSEAESTPGHMELSDATEKTEATPGIGPGTFRLVAQYLNHYATPGPDTSIVANLIKKFIIILRNPKSHYHI
jgi:hypothetical protein